MDSSEQHILVQVVKDLYVELGRSPTRAEFVARVRGADRKLAEMGGMTVLLTAAGLPTYDDRRCGKKQRITNEVFTVRDIREHLVSHEPPKLHMAEPFPRIMSLSDIHWPFEMEAVVDRFISAVEKNQPEFVILNGDAFDMYCAAKFPRSHNVFTPIDEEKLAKEKNVDFWKRIQAGAPEAKCFQMLGNHDVRPAKRTVESLPTMEHWAAKYMRDLFTFEGVTTVHDSRQELRIGNVLALHGYRSKLGDHRDYVRCNVMTGHTHRGGVVFRNSYDIETNSQRVIWELNSGYAGNPMAKGLTYTAQRIHDWTWGWSEVDERGPRFVPA